MWNWADITMIACVACFPVCGLTGHLLFMEMIAQNREADTSFPIPGWGDRSFATIAKIFRLHKKHFPLSRLRQISIFIYGLLFVAFFVLISVAFTHPGSPGRP